MNKTVILSPLEAAEQADSTAFYADYPWRSWGLFKRIRQMSRDGVCGELCSLRFTWQSPKKKATDESGLLFRTLPWLLDLAWELADAPLVSLYLEKAAGLNQLFGLAYFDNGVAAEIEMNEGLPDSMPETRFIKANFSGGHLTNQPVAGHFNEEGSILANDAGMSRFVVENRELYEVHDELEQCRRIEAAEIECGKFPAGPLHSRELIAAIRGALR